MREHAPHEGQTPRSEAAVSYDSRLAPSTQSPAVFKLRLPLFQRQPSTGTTAGTCRIAARTREQASAFPSRDSQAAHVVDPACDALPRGNRPVETATAVEMNRVGLRPTSSGSFPPLFAIASATDAPAGVHHHRNRCSRCPELAFMIVGIRMNRPPCWAILATATWFNSHSIYLSKDSMPFSRPISTQLANRSYCRRRFCS